MPLTNEQSRRKAYWPCSRWTADFLRISQLRLRIRCADLSILLSMSPFIKKIALYTTYQTIGSRLSTSWKSEYLEGIKILKGHPWLWITILAFSFINISYRGIIVILVPWLFKVHLHLDPFIYGIGITCSGGGAIVAAFIYGSKTKWPHRGLLAYGSVLLSGIALLLLPFTSSPVTLALLMAVEDFGFMIFGLIWETNLQELVPAEAFGRVVSLDLLGSFALLPLIRVPRDSY
jgi:predicted MFS family arabinose efflux permease